MKFLPITSLKINALTEQLYLHDSNFQQLVNSIALFGVLEPIIVFPLTDQSGNYQIISGNRRFKACLELDISDIPCVISEPVELTEALVSAHQEYRVKLLSDIIRELRILEEEFGLKQGTHSNNPNLTKAKEYRKKLVEEHNKSTIDRLRQYDKRVRELVGDDTLQYEKFMEDLNRSGNVSGSLKKVNDLLTQRNNNLVAEGAETVQTDEFTFFRSSCADMSEVDSGSIATICTSPPYFQLRLYDHEESHDVQLGQEATVEEFIDNLASIFDEAKRVLKSDGSLFVNIADNVQNGRMLGVPYKFVNAMIGRGWILNDTIIWSKTNPIYQNHKRTVASHEYVFHFVKSVEFYHDRSWIPNAKFQPHELTYGDVHGKLALRSNWRFDGHTLTTPVPNNHDLRELCKQHGMELSHSATFPKEIPLVAIMSTSKPGDTVLDMFLGTGTSAEVAVSLGRRFIGYELSPVYLKFSEIRMSTLQSTYSNAA